MPQSLHILNCKSLLVFLLFYDIKLNIFGVLLISQNLTFKYSILGFLLFFKQAK